MQNSKFQKKIGSRVNSTSMYNINVQCQKNIDSRFLGSPAPTLPMRHHAPVGAIGPGELPQRPLDPLLNL